MESSYRNHLGPAFGALALDKISDEQISRLRAFLVKTHHKPKTINNVLTPLNSCLKLAVQWKIIAAMPCAIHIPTVSDERPDFYDFDEYAQLCEGAAKVGTRELALVRLAGEAGLRRGELMALRWTDVNFRRRAITVEQAAWHRSKKRAKASGEPELTIKAPKGG